MSLDEVHRWYHLGVFSQELFDWYHERWNRCVGAAGCTGARAHLGPCPC